MTIIDTTTVRPDCDYCLNPSDGRHARLDPGDLASKRVALAHQPCYEQFMRDLAAWTTDENGLPVRPVAGRCHMCSAWTLAGRVVNEIHSDSGAGATIVRCAACCARPPQRDAAEEPRTYPL